MLCGEYDLCGVEEEETCDSKVTRGSACIMILLCSCDPGNGVSWNSESTMSSGSLHYFSADILGHCGDRGNML